MKKKAWLLSLLIVFLGFLSIACVEMGPDIKHSQSVPYEDLESLKATLDIAAGRLTVLGGSDDLMEGDFTFNVERWRPRIEYTRFDGRGIVSVDQGRSRRGSFGRSKNRWKVRFRDDIPLDLRIDFGAGEGDLDLSSFWLKNLVIDMGVGDLELDLTGDYQENFMVQIDGGVGSATLYLPEDIGVRVDIDGGLGSIDAHGFNKRGSIYTNEAYESSAVTIKINVDAGIGSIELILR